MNMPTEYFGPHAKRWTHPDTGVTYSLKPRDYHQLVAEQKEWEEEVRERQLRDEAVSAAWDDKALDARTTADTMNAEQLTTDTMHVEPAWPNTISRMAQEAADAAAAARSAARSAEESRDKALEDSGLMIAPNGLLVRGRIHSATLSDDGMGYVSSSPAAPADVRPGERPTGRWFAKFGRRPRLWVATGLVYIIAIIGVAAVAGVFS